MTEFVSARPPFAGDIAMQCAARSIEGVEVFMNDIRSRTQTLHGSEEAREAIVASLSTAGVQRVHSSYWASPTSFLANVKFGELADRFEDQQRVREYFGDLSGEHIFARWADEYAIACELGARAFVFHLIDYHPVDGAWEFTIAPSVVRQAMATITQQLLRKLDDRGLLHADSPVIELENAGWGLEFGAQTADDFVALLEDTWDPHGHLRVGWDVNHLMHALGLRDGRAAFLLPANEISPAMAEMEASSNGEITVLTERWIEANILEPRLDGRVSAVHLSDCVPKTEEFFRNGALTPAHVIGGTWDRRRAEGLALVLEHYDSHLPLGEGALDPLVMRRVIRTLADRHPLMVLHELKNSTDLWADVDMQRHRLWE
ncbi:hypothetical protein ACX3O0_13725 [Homoserinimonas sp. A447]